MDVSMPMFVLGCMASFALAIVLMTGVGMPCKKCGAKIPGQWWLFFTITPFVFAIVFAGTYSLQWAIYEPQISNHVISMFLQNYTCMAKPQYLQYLPLQNQTDAFERLNFTLKNGTKITNASFNYSCNGSGCTAYIPRAGANE